MHGAFCELPKQSLRKARFAKAISKAQTLCNPLPMWLSPFVSAVETEIRIGEPEVPAQSLPAIADEPTPAPPKLLLEKAAKAPKPVKAPKAKAAAAKALVKPKAKSSGGVSGADLRASSAKKSKLA